MASETVVTVVGNLTADPELKFTPAGTAVATFTIAATPRLLDRQTGEWRDGEPLFLRCALWRDAAEHVAESLVRGTRVIAQGRLRQRSYETPDGDRRTIVELEVDEIGPSLRFAVAAVSRTERAHSRQGPEAVAADNLGPATPVTVGAGAGVDAQSA